MNPATPPRRVFNFDHADYNVPLPTPEELRQARRRPSVPARPAPSRQAPTFTPTITTRIRMGAAHNGVQSARLDGSDTAYIDLNKTNPEERQRLAAVLCELHGIGSRAQWAEHGNYLKREAAARRRAQGERKAELALRSREVSARRHQGRPQRTA